MHTNTNLDHTKVSYLERNSNPEEIDDNPKMINII